MFFASNLWMVCTSTQPLLPPMQARQLMVDLGVPPDNVFLVDLSSSDSPASAAALKVALQVTLCFSGVCVCGGEGCLTQGSEK